MRIRTRLLFLVLAVLIPALLVAALGVGYVYSEQQHSIQQNMRETTRALALVLDKEIARREGVLRTLAASPAIDEGSLQRFYEHAEKVSAIWGTTIFLSNSEGVQLLNTRMPFGEKNLPLSLPLLKFQQKSGEDVAMVSNIYRAPLRNNYGFAVQIPVIRDGKTLYYIGMGSPVSQLQSVFQEQQLPTEWVGTILDRDGRVVARSRNPDEFIAKQVSSGFTRKFNANVEGFYDAVSLSGVPVFAFFSRAPHSEWIFVVNVPKSTMFNTAIKATAFMGTVLLLLLGLAVFAALAVARSTARPIEALRISAERLGRGETVTAETSGLAETIEVSQAMARAGSEISTAKAHLEQRVKEAVEAAERSQQGRLQGQKLEALGRLTGGIAHDFNNVLQTLSTGLHVAYVSNNDPKVKSSLEMCRRAVRRATELISQLMAFGRVQDARLETVNLSEQVRTMMPLLKGALRSDIVFQCEIPFRLWAVTLDALQFELALLNLTINARDAMPSGGRLRLEARNESVHLPTGEIMPGEYVCLSLTDSGEGMNPEVLDKALDPFFTTKSIGKGSGMGLAQVYGFAKQVGGTLILSSKEGVGTCATLYLPRAKDAVQPVLPDQGLTDDAVCDGVILFVEDDQLVRDTVAPALKAAGFHVLMAYDGEQAVAILESSASIDLVFSDIVMPGKVSGIELAKYLQVHQPDVRVVLATGYSDHRVALPHIRILSKPYDIIEIVKVFNEELQAGNVEKAAP